MAATRDNESHKPPVYKSRENFISTIVTVVVLAISVFMIWQMRSTAVHKIDNTLDRAAVSSPGSTVDTTRAKALGEAARTDPVGYDISNYLQANYGKIVLAIYFLLAALSLATVARFLIFLGMSFNRKKYYPDDTSLEFFLKHKPKSWEEFYESIQNQDHRNSRFWRVIKDSAMVTNASGHYDHLYLHCRSRIDRIFDYLNETALYESISTASPAAGFFGTLVGLLFIFSQSQGYQGGLSQAPAFAVGMKVAIITSLWGLFNLGLAIVSSYFTRRIARRINEQMVIRTFAVCEVVESLKMKQKRTDAKKENVEEKVSV